MQSELQVSRCILSHVVLLDTVWSFLSAKRSVQIYTYFLSVCFFWAVFISIINIICHLSCHVYSFRTCIRQSPTDGEGSGKGDWRRSQRQQLPVYQREVCHHQEHWGNHHFLKAALHKLFRFLLNFSSYWPQPKGETPLSSWSTPSSCVRCALDAVQTMGHLW